MSMTLAEWSAYTKEVSSTWVAGISELYNRLSLDQLSDSQKYQLLADYHYDKALEVRDWANFPSTLSCSISGGKIFRAASSMKPSFAA